MIGQQTKERVLVEYLALNAEIERMESAIDHAVLPPEYDALVQRRDCAVNLLVLAGMSVGEL